ncbi:MAG: hypothetical protein FWE33_05115 [Defluviitaleaceae bacterium]|nr:hypothetical protein [Defluviitaleaceae bacterium]
MICIKIDFDVSKPKHPEDIGDNPEIKIEEMIYELKLEGHKQKRNLIIQGPGFWVLIVFLILLFFIILPLTAVSSQEERDNFIMTFNEGSFLFVLQNGHWLL